MIDRKSELDALEDVGIKPEQLHTLKFENVNFRLVGPLASMRRMFVCGGKFFVCGGKNNKGEEEESKSKGRRRTPAKDRKQQ